MSFYGERNVKAARKAHVCDECRKPIDIGSPYRQWSALQDGDFWFGHVHKDCHDFAVGFIKHDWDYTRPFLCDFDPEEWDWDVEWLLKNLPSHALLERLPHPVLRCVESALSSKVGR